MTNPTVVPTRAAGRFDHSLLCTLSGLSCEQVELIRADLFDYLDKLTAGYSYGYPEKMLARKDDEIERTASRLKELMRYQGPLLGQASTQRQEGQAV